MGQFLIVLEFKNSFKLNVTMYNTEHQLFFFQRESQRATKNHTYWHFCPGKTSDATNNIHIIVTTKNNNI